MAVSNRGSRRDFIKAGVSSGTALVIGFFVPTRFAGQDSNSARRDAFKPNAWIRITTDNQITVQVEVPEMGQGPRTADTMILAEELDADWSALRVEQAPVIPQVYQHLSTGGSGGVETAWGYMRLAGAQAREMLREAAANKWSVPKTECSTENSTVIHTPTGRRLTYGQLVDTAANLPAPSKDDIVLKQAKDFRLIGKPMPRVDVPAKVDGSARFGIDVRVPKMLFAVVARCPHFGGKLISFDATAAKAIPGVQAVFPVPPLGAIPNVIYNANCDGGIAVVADSTWSAIEGRKALKVSWDRGPGANETTESLRKMMLQQAVAPPSFIAINQGDALRVFSGAAKKIEATYELPFQAHATMEPMNTTIWVREGTVEVWSPTQIGAILQQEIAQLSGVPADKVNVHMTLCGGSFGRRYQWDYAAEAWQVVREIKKPVQLVWTREDDIQHDFYRQYSYHHMVGALDATGSPVAWSHRVVSTPIRSVFDPPERLKDPRHVAAQELGGADVLPYAIPNFRLDYAPVKSVVPRAWWRSVESSFTACAMECFIDELAHAAGRDPLEFRMRLLQDRRLLRAVMWPDNPPLDTAKFRSVLELAAQKSAWGKPLPPGHGRGIACHFSFGSYIAHVAEVSVDKNGMVQVDRIVSAVNCGTAVNPDGVRAMTEGAINYALTPVLTGEITIKDGAVEQSNFHDYQVLRISSAPKVEVHIVPSSEDPMGMGEPGVPPLAPALANAVFDATGVRIRRLPIQAELLRKSAPDPSATG
ncbi:MAG TPA: xanthine dehydrogenase family protein molybdopterin-binding subunit [Terriglobia bacterium]|nr:xanthine dehydrogenase family protein molybdopterin-binding subunit [Terriglobia bacterium]